MSFDTGPGLLVVSQWMLVDSKIFKYSVVCERWVVDCLAV